MMNPKIRHSLLCLIGVVSVASSTLPAVYHKYYLIKTPVMTWADAKIYCRETYHDIATVGCDTDWVNLRKESADKGLTEFVWVGLYNDIDNWYWSFNDVPLKNQTLRGWYSGEPNNLNGVESCATIDQLGMWHDEQCTELRPFICYDSTNSAGNTYVVVVTPLLSWYDAQAYCRKYHTDLASSTTSTENSELQKKVAPNVDTWFGLVRHTWKWVDNTVQDATNLLWTDGQPNNGNGAEDCGALYIDKLYDRPCSDLNPFFCHTVIQVQQQKIIKLQVNSEESVFDPSVQSLILKQIEQKLQEYRMSENVTVTWRVQPDGNIFYRDGI